MSENSDKVRGVILGKPVQERLRALVDQAAPFGKGKGGAAFIESQTGTPVDTIHAACMGAPIKDGYATMLTNLAVGNFVLKPPAEATAPTA